MIDCKEHGGAVIGWFIFIMVELILLAVCPLLSILIAAVVLFVFAIVN